MPWDDGYSGDDDDLIESMVERTDLSQLRSWEVSEAVID